jgi:hypothetical protein
MPRYYTRYQQAARCEEIKERLCDHVRTYFAEWRKPIPMHVLSVHYGRQLTWNGSTLRLAIEDLEKRGAIIVRMTEKGARQVSPGLTKFVRGTGRSGGARPPG